MSKKWMYVKGILLVSSFICLLFGFEKVALASNEVNQEVTLLVTEKNGFVHPGISVNPDKLQETRQQLMNKQEPWYSYYQAMLATDYASKTFVSANLKEGILAEPNDPTFKGSGTNVNLSKDGFRAYTQSVLYYLTGDNQYRYNALRLIRIWENMDPTNYQYYADAHIHVGTPFYYMISAAELIKYTEAVTPTYANQEAGISSYDLTWQEADDEKLTNNLINPVIATFLYSNERYLNQHLYPVIGATAGYIFTDNQERYGEAVEWALVNATTTKPEINGALSNQFYPMTTETPGNPTGTDYIQHLEMGRDQAHGSGDVLNFIGIARILSQQKTKVNPETGTITQAKSGQTMYEFLDRRLLKGSEQLFHYMNGFTVPWTNYGNQDYSGNISEAYRGRTGLYYNMSELYDAYRYQEGVSTKEMKQLAPTISEMAQNLTRPIFYNGTTKTNFWGSFSDNKMTEIGCEYWLSIPKERQAETEIALPEPEVESSAVYFSERGARLDEKRATKQVESDQSFIRVKPANKQEQIKETLYDKNFNKDTTTVRGGSQVSLPSLIKASAKTTQQLGLTFRSNGVTIVKISHNNYFGEAYQELTLPDTKGEWQTMAYSIAPDKQITPTAKQLENMDYYSIIGSPSVTVDLLQVDYLNETGGLQTTVPEINERTPITLPVVKGIPLTRPLAIQQLENATIELQGMPSELTIDAEQTINYLPKTGNQTVAGVLIVKNDQIMVTQKIVLASYKTTQEALDTLLSKYAADEYTTASMKKVDTLKKEIEGLIKENNQTATVSTKLEALVNAIDDLELLNPPLADGSLNYAAYPAIVANVETMNPLFVKNLVDNDPGTFSGDLKKPVIFDFGKQYKITAEAFALQARTGFPNRSEGTNIYGSNDQITWQLLSENPSSKTSELESIPVKTAQKTQGYRFIKLQVDQPGAPTDPSYPGIASYSEFRIFGKRREEIDVMQKVSLSGNGLKEMVQPKDTVTLDFSSTEKLTNVSATIDGQPVSPVSQDGLTWQAEVTLAETISVGKVPFTIDYQLETGQSGATVQQTTDKTFLYKSNDQRRITDLQNRVSATSSGEKADVAKWLDEKIDTMAEFRKNEQGETFVTFDFSDRPITFGRVEFLARQDEYANRAATYLVQGSQDGKNWEDLTIRGKATQDWQMLYSKNETTNYAYLRMYCWANFLGITELRVFEGS